MRKVLQDLAAMFESRARDSDATKLSIPVGTAAHEREVARAQTLREVASTIRGILNFKRT